MNNAESIREISPQALMAMGVSDLAYVRPIQIEGQDLFAVYAADGTQLTVLPSYELAVATIRRNDLEPVSIH